jgi:prepilin-type processing-associated H-X9-DG protein
MKLKELITIILVIFVMFGMGIKAIQIANETADITACQENMRLIVEGVQLYENARGYLPPSRTQNNHPAWNLLILPYLGYMPVHNVLVQSHLYDTDYQGVLENNGSVPVNPYDIGDKNSIGAVSTFSGNPKAWYRFTCQTSGNPIDAVTKNDGDGIVWENIHKALAEVTEFRNPNRQPSATIKKVTADTIYTNSFTNLKFDSDLYEQSCMRGAVSDYATAFSKRSLVLNTYKIDKNGEFIDVTKSENMNKSTTYVIGEKFIPPFALINDTPIANMWNGGLHRTHATINAFNSSMRYINLDIQEDEKSPIATANTILGDSTNLTGDGKIRYPRNFQSGEFLWGSNHPETLNIGFLDGSVKPVSKNIDPDMFNNSWIPQPKTINFVD